MSMKHNNMLGTIKNFTEKHFEPLVYLFYLYCALTTLYLARLYGLFPRPLSGTDQLTMLRAAEDLRRGELPGAGYLYSYSYTLFLYVLCFLASGKLVLMRALQAAVCAFVPVFVYRLALRLRLKRIEARLAALTYCFYGPSLLISLSFLRAGTLSLCFVLFAYFMATAYVKRSRGHYLAAGVMMGLCVLGRENFIPIAGVPFLMLLMPSVRKYAGKRLAGHYLVGIAFVLLPVMVYNSIMFSSPALIPGHWNNIMGAYHGTAANSGGKLLGSILSGMPTQAYGFMSSYEFSDSLSFYAHSEIVHFLRIFAVPANLLTALALTAVLSQFKKKPSLFTGLLVAAYAGSMLPFTMFYRFRIPAIPLLCVLAVSGMVLIAKQLAKGKSLSRFSGLALATLIFAATCENSFERRTLGEKISVVRILCEHERFDEALGIIERLPPNDPKTLYAKTLLLRFIDASGDTKRAQRLYRKWLEQQQNKL